MSHQTLINTIHLLELTLTGEIHARETLDQAIRQIEDKTSAAENAALHAAQHFISDLDIRALDTEYEQSARAKLQKMIEDLRRSVHER